MASKFAKSTDFDLVSSLEACLIVSRGAGRSMSSDTREFATALVDELARRWLPLPPGVQEPSGVSASGNGLVFRMHHPATGRVIAVYTAASGDPRDIEVHHIDPGAAALAQAVAEIYTGYGIPDAATRLKIELPIEELRQITRPWYGRPGLIYKGPDVAGTGTIHIEETADPFGITSIWDRKPQAAQQQPTTQLAQQLAQQLGNAPVIQHTQFTGVRQATAQPAAADTAATPERACGNCPRFIYPRDVDDQVETLGKVVDLPWCAGHGIPLGSHHDPAPRWVDLQKAAAADCDLYGTERNTEVPLLGVIASGSYLAPDGPTPDSARPTACSGCRYHIPQSTMLATLGLPVAGCQATGAVIRPGQEIAAARNCDYGYVGHTESGDPNKILLRAPYAKSLTVIHLDDTGEVMDAPQPDPAQYVSDQDVTAEDEAAGIRAWRRIEDPDGTGNSVLLPIFDPARFDDVERDKIPQTGDDERPELYRDHQGILYKALVLWRHMGETPALNGIAGVGKTEFFRYAAWMMQLPFERISITGSTEVDDLQGRFVLEGGETRFHYGRVPAAWQRPCVIVVDEPNVGPPEVWQFLRPLTDNSKQLVVDANKGERIARNPHCFLGMAFNPSWDMRNVGTHEISDADGSRLMHIAVPEPDEKLERKILAERCKADGYDIPKATLDAILAIAKDVRGLAREDSFPIHWGTRQQIKVARSTQWFTLAQAYRLAAGDLIDPEANEQLTVIVKSHTPAQKSAPKNSRKNISISPF